MVRLTFFQTKRENQMKKLIALLLIAAACLSLVACSEGGNTETDGNTETVEITLDNWQEYFEIKFGANFIKNPFGEITSVESGMRIYLKPEYFNRLVSANVHFDIKATNGSTSIYNYDLKSGNVAIETGHGVGAYGSFACGSSICSYQYDSAHTSDNVILQIAALSNNGVGGYTEDYICAVQISDFIATWVALKWETIEVSRVLGTITLIQK